MKTLLILILIVSVIIIWAIMFPNAKVTITATGINNFRRKFLLILKNWTNNRIQARRIAKNLVEHNQLFTYAPNQDLEKAFAKVIIFRIKGKKIIVIPTKKYVVSKLAKEQLDNYSLSMIMEYYPNTHWQRAEITRIPYINFFFVKIAEK
ncbi:hypothetical protein EFO75_06935 [Limosilactobacillus reuteri]|uniref:hypothetical protein n=1 Tax=Limosilactobacillus reuteri TaxID=1598 RepID=UPI0021A56788|nr:hypothetical protein [Limosilactobacillus reuteri]MCT3208389.1 hypothetical protein [Limosilactobacillus reuteri]MCT3216922.1 hypothetical protein [Limosilactobacillus reuteri]